MQSRIHVLKLNRHQSDGDMTKKPHTSSRTRNDEPYLFALGSQWAKAQGLPISKSVVYKLESLPAGFAGYQQRRRHQPSHIDRYLYGHPKGHYRSVPEFLPHFLQLMNHGNAEACSCKLCDVQVVASASPEMFANQSGASAAPPLEKAELGIQKSPPTSHPDTIYERFDKLFDRIQHLRLDENMSTQLEEESTFDWLYADETGSRKPLSRWQARPSYLPRPGELVLLAANLSICDTLA